MTSNNLKAIRKGMGLSLEEFGKRYGYDKGNISKMERGLRKIPIALRSKLNIAETAWTGGDIERVRFIFK